MVWINIIDFPQYKISECGEIINSKGNVLKPWKNNGYPVVSLCNNGKISKRYVHRLVAQFFLNNGKPIDKTVEIHHIDKNKENNLFENLSLVSCCGHRSFHSKQQIGRKHSELTKEKIRQKQIGMKASLETRKKMSESHKKLIVGDVVGE